MRPPFQQTRTGSDEQRIDLLFVYGTLQRGFSQPMAIYLRTKADYLGPAKVKGRLFDVGTYPALIQTREGGYWINGELFGSPALTDILPALDVYEAYYPDSFTPSDYLRKPVEVDFQSKAVRAWTYIYHLTTKGLKEIPGGDYLSFIQKDKT